LKNICERSEQAEPFIQSYRFNDVDLVLNILADISSELIIFLSVLGFSILKKSILTVPFPGGVFNYIDYQ